MTIKTKLLIITVLSIWAFFNAFYLSYDWLFTVENTSSLYFPVWNVVSGWSFCDINETLSCSTVLQHPAAQVFWIPFPVLAMVVYPVILIISLLWIFKKIRNVFGYLSSIWLAWILFNSYFIYQETVNIWAFCPLCLLCSAIIITIFGISFYEVRKECLLNKKK